MKALAIDLIAINTVLLDKTVLPTTSFMWRRYKHTRQKYDTPTDENRPMIMEFDEIVLLDNDGSGALSIQLVLDDERPMLSYCGEYVIIWEDQRVEEERKKDEDQKLATLLLNSLSTNTEEETP